MSYILDALRKADAQRERDPARGIHAQPMRVAIGERRVHDGYRAGFWTATTAALMAAVAWYFYQDSGGQPVPAPARTELAVAAPAPASVAPPAAAPVAEAPAAAVLPPPVVVAPPIVVPAPAARQAEPAPGARATARQSARNSAGDAAVAARTAQAPASAAAAMSAPPAAAASVPTAPPLAGLPADAPKLAISGGVYSANAAQRMLIVNGQVFNEGVEVAPGLLLEEIRSKAAVIRFRGSRYLVPY